MTGCVGVSSRAQARLPSNTTATAPHSGSKSRSQWWFAGAGVKCRAERSAADLARSVSEVRVAGGEERARMETLDGGRLARQITKSSHRNKTTWIAGGFMRTNTERLCLI